MKKYIFLFLFLLVNNVNAQRIISHENGITFNTGSSNVVVDGNLTVATNLTVGGLYVDGVSKLYGIPINTNWVESEYSNYGLQFNGNGETVALISGARRAAIGNGVYVSSLGFFGFSSGGEITSGKDVYLYRDAANILALRNGTASNTFRVYGGYVDSSNFSRASLAHDGTSTTTLAGETAGTGSDDQSLKIKLAGNGALYVDGDTAGNARGINAIDLQVSRSAATQVASGAYSMASGSQNTASGNYSVSVGYGSTASGLYSYAAGRLNTASSGSSFATGYSSLAYLDGQHSYANGPFAAQGDAQGSRFVMRNATSGTTPVDLLLDGAGGYKRAVLPANTSWGFTVNVVGRTTDGGSGAEQSGYYEIKGLIRRDGANNTVLVGYTTKTTIAEDDATWDVTASADDTNEALNITCTGGSGDTVRWVATINLTEVGG